MKTGMKRRNGRALLRLALMATTLGSTVGCKRAAKVQADEMALIPRESSLLLSINVDRLRGAKFWQSLVDLRNDPNNKKQYDEFVEGVGIDPLVQVHRVVLGVPSDVDTSHELALVIKGSFNEAKLIQYVREQAKREGSELRSETYNGKTWYTDPKAEIVLCVLDPTTLAVSGKTWIRSMIDLYNGKGASVHANEALQALVKRVHSERALWAVGIVPPGKVQLGQGKGGEIKSIVSSIDLQNGLELEVLADTPSAGEAKQLADEIRKSISESKTNPMVGVLGLGEVFGATKITDQGATMKLELSLNAAQTEEVSNRIKGFAQMLGSGEMKQLPGPSVEELPSEDSKGPPSPGQPVEKAPGGAAEKAPPSKAAKPREKKKEVKKP